MSRGSQSILVAIALALATRASGQGPAPSAELRLEGLVASHVAVEGGAAVILPAGVYLRNSLAIASGVVSRDSGAALVSRLEATTRFLLDPFHESPYGLSLGGGVGITDQSNGRWRPYLAVLVDLELPSTRSWTPAVQLGLGSGARLGILFRSGNHRWR